jgi:hypothetical protein
MRKPEPIVESWFSNNNSEIVEPESYIGFVFDS